MAMKPRIMVRVLRWLVVAAAAPLLMSAALADNLQVASSGGFAAALRALAPGFEQRTGHTLTLVWGPSMGETSGAIPKRLERGESLDVVIMVGDSLDKLIAQGKVADVSHRLLAVSKIAAVVPAGAPHPDVSSLDGLKQALFHARAIAYSDSASGEYLSKVLFPRLDVNGQIQQKSRMIPAEPVGQVVARGEADLGFQQLSELQAVKGIDIVGEIPADVQLLTRYSAGIVANSKEQAAAQALIEYLASPEVAQVIRQTGLAPASTATH